MGPGASDKRGLFPLVEKMNGSSKAEKWKKFAKAIVTLSLSRRPFLKGPQSIAGEPGSQAGERARELRLWKKSGKKKSRTKSGAEAKKRRGFSEKEKLGLLESGGEERREGERKSMGERFSSRLLSA